MEHLSPLSPDHGQHETRPPIHRQIWLWGVSIALACLVGLVLGRWSGARSMPLVVPSATSPETTFARDMAAHHEQAVAMSLAIWPRTQDPTLKIIAQDILLTQQAQIGQMKGWLAAWGVPISGPAAPMAGHRAMMGMASQADINALSTAPIVEAEAAFLTLMIAHHRGGIQMARDIQEQTRRPEVLRLANAIMTSQASEIRALEELLAHR